MKRVYVHTHSDRFFSLRKLTKEKFRVSFTQTYILCIFLIGFLGIYYVWSLNANANSGYNISQLETEQKELRDQLKLLETRLADEESLRKLNDTDDGMREIRTDEINYVYLEELENIILPSE